PGYGLLLQDTGTSRAANEHAVTAAPGQYAGRFNLSSSANWTAVVATFKPAAASGSAPTITTGTLTSTTCNSSFCGSEAEQNAFYNAIVSVAGGKPPYSFIITSGSLPPGLTFDVNN